MKLPHLRETHATQRVLGNKKVESLMLLRAIYASVIISISPLFSMAQAEEPVAKMDTSLLQGFGSLHNGLAVPLTHTEHAASHANSRPLVLTDNTPANRLEEANTQRSLRDRIRIQIDDTAIYGVFSGGSQTGATDGEVGLGLERPIDRGLALNLELLQPTNGAKRSGNAGDRTKAALKLLFRF
ncbi:MAG: hypothetical protein VX228_12885 [Pseudomonadota bacterium]|nr:hypothetical protein [Pseudomonadota bacterium]